MFLETFFDLLLRKISLMYNLKTKAVLAGAQWFMSGWSATVYVQLERNGICPAGAQWYMSGFCLRISGPVTRDIFRCICYTAGTGFFICVDSDYFWESGSIKNFLIRNYNILLARFEIILTVAILFNSHNLKLSLFWKCNIPNWLTFARWEVWASVGIQCFEKILSLYF